MDDFVPKTPGDPLALLLRQDLAPLSVAELEARITALEAEIQRTRNRLDGAVHHRASADAIFKR